MILCIHDEIIHVADSRPHAWQFHACILRCARREQEHDPTRAARAPTGERRDDGLHVLEIDAQQFGRRVDRAPRGIEIVHFQFLANFKSIPRSATRCALGGSGGSPPNTTPYLLSMNIQDHAERPDGCGSSGGGEAVRLSSGVSDRLSSRMRSFSRLEGWPKQPSSRTPEVIK